MIGAKISVEYNHQHIKRQSFTEHVYLADYTEQTKLQPVKRSVEFFCPNCPTDIKYFTLKNPPKLSVDGIDFDNNSFTKNGITLTQCEAVFYPNPSIAESWILFCELKYSSKPQRNQKNLTKALNQLFKTRYYYVQTGVITKANTSYLIGSLPMQSEPFPNFTIAPGKLASFKKKHNVVLRLQNTVEILDQRLLLV